MEADERMGRRERGRGVKILLTLYGGRGVWGGEAREGAHERLCWWKTFPKFPKFLKFLKFIKLPTKKKRI